MTNRQWVLASQPKGAADANTWRLTETARPKPGPGQILIRTQWLSVDPYMRGRISPSANYAKGVQIGEVMQGGGVGEVV
jgi:NADPH-dependent curcumin reductase CurA